MIKTVKVMLLPNNKQKTKLFECAGIARFAYNWALDYEKANYEAENSFLSHYELRRIFTELKTQPEYAWLNDYSNNIPKQAIKDACTAYQRFFDGIAGFPKFKSRRKSRPTFYADTSKISFTSTHVKLEKLTTSRKKNRKKFNFVKLAEPGRIPIGAKYSNPRITFDGLNWWISVGIDCEESHENPTNQGIGIDVGIKNLVICSDKNVYPNINKTAKVRKLKKKKRRLQRRVSKKYSKNKKGGRYCKTRNIVKSERKLLKLTRKLTNIRHSYLHSVTSEIINREPKFIVLKDLSVQDMMKNRHLSEAIQEQCFYEFYRQIQYKCEWHNIEFIMADRYYPSSKMCSRCGNIKKDLKLSDRIYRCSVCGFVIDRDFQASVNLMNYGLTMQSQ